MVLFGGFFDEPKSQRARPQFNAKDKEHLYTAQKGKCNGCGIKFPARNLTVDHIKPFSKGGSDKPSNLQLLCNSCNSTKCNGTQAQFKKRLADQGINGATKPPAKAPAKAAIKKATGTRKAPAQAKRAAKPQEINIFDIFS